MYTEKDLIRVALRENNTKRNYLIVNPLQGKHVPVPPGKALKLSSALAGILKSRYKGEKLLLIGFAETATAIGIQVAIGLGSLYIQTTREDIPGARYIFFSEEHSHATEQRLVKDDIDIAVEDKGIDRIIFIEDELTTGNTILNLIKALVKEYPGRLKFAVASLLNGMAKEYLDIYNEKGTGLHYLVKTDNSTYARRAGLFAGDGEYIPCCCAAPAGGYNTFNASSWMDTRRMVEAPEYKKACENLWEEIYAYIGEKRNKSILVAGTEEFMYPALYVGSKLEDMGNDTRTHSTTRSPVVASMEKDYPLHTRYELRSVYDKDRVTYIYDIDTYDEVIIITDSHSGEDEGVNSLVNAVRHKNKNILLVRWCPFEKFV